MDGLDLALCQFEVETRKSGFSIPTWSMVSANTYPLDPEWKIKLTSLPTASALEFVQVNHQYGHYCGKVVHQFLQHLEETPKVIGFHGHTLFHYPDQGFTTQVGSGAALAALTGITTVSDFRGQDVALGGQGAPMAPAADLYLYPGYDFYLNLGGIANVTAMETDRTMAFDICPANQILDPIARKAKMEYDDQGALASTGWVNDSILEQWNGEDFYQDPFPKSLDNAWSKEKLLAKLELTPLSVPDQLRTAVEHISHQIQRSLTQLTQHEARTQRAFKLFVTGGGVHNTFLMRRLQEKLDPLGIEIVLPQTDQINFKEAALMALMAVLRLENIHNVFSSVTGASRDSVGGAVHFGNG